MAFGDGRAEPVAITPARFDAWYAELRVPLRGYLRRVAKSAAPADDLFQETWIRFLTHPPHTLDAAAVRAYVFTIATRLATDSWRRESTIARWIRPLRRRREDGATPSDPIVEVADGAPGADARYEAREEIARALASLGLRDRALLWLAHVERYDHREIATILGVRPKSVRVLLHRARRRALESLRGPEPHSGGSS